MAQKFALFGNSGSGKSTLATLIANEMGLARLDLDSIYWNAGQIGVKRPQTEIEAELRRFFFENPKWVIEGCYEDLVEQTFTEHPTLVFLDPGVDQCLENCKQRPWEAHKFESKAEQDNQLPMLLQWVADYYEREGYMSHAEHERLYKSYQGPKLRVGAITEYPQLLTQLCK